MTPWGRGPLVDTRGTPTRHCDNWLLQIFEVSRTLHFYFLLHKHINYNLSDTQWGEQVFDTLPILQFSHLQNM